MIKVRSVLSALFEFVKYFLILSLLLGLFIFAPLIAHVSKGHSNILGLFTDPLFWLIYLLYILCFAPFTAPAVLLIMGLRRLKMGRRKAALIFLTIAVSGLFISLVVTLTGLVNLFGPLGDLTM